MSSNIDYSALRQKEADFAQSFPLQAELGGIHPYIYTAVQKDLEPQYIFVKSDFAIAELNLLTQKIIDSFSLPPEQVKIVSLAKGTELITFLNDKKTKAVISFEPFTGLDKASQGKIQVKGNIPVLLLWNAEILKQSPQLKKNAWESIKKLKTYLPE